MLVVGQVPPPVNGQTLMIQEFLSGSYEGIRLEHVPMKFSRATSEIGAFGLRKLGTLLLTLAAIVRARIRTGASVLYYPPAGPNLVPVLRDMVLLGATRWMFRQTVFHFHAAGLSAIYPRLPRLLRPFYHLAYDRPDLAIFTTAATSGEAESLSARARAIVPCGVRDMAPALLDRSERSQLASGPPTILFAGILCEGKGVMVLLEACREMLAAGTRFRLVCMGAFQSEEFRGTVERAVREYGLDGLVEFPGVVQGEAKTEQFQNADIFCFPSHYAMESFGVVLIEAMSFSLPIVATRWQGIPEVVGEGDGSFLVDVKDSRQLALRLMQLVDSPSLREAMGSMNRQRYLDHYTLGRYRSGMQEAFSVLQRLSPMADTGASCHAAMKS